MGSRGLLVSQAGITHQLIIRSLYVGSIFYSHHIYDGSALCILVPLPPLDKRLNFRGSLSPNKWRVDSPFFEGFQKKMEKKVELIETVLE